MQTICYQTNIKNLKGTRHFRIQFQQIIADLVTLFEHVQNNYILVLEGGRAVSNIIGQTFNKENGDYRLSNEPTN